MALRLGEINEFEDNLSCAITMLCAISGKTPTYIGRLLQRIAKEDNRTIAERREDYAPGDWLEAIKRLGGKVETEEQDLDDIESLRTIDEWMKDCKSLELIVIATSDFDREDHVFAAQCGKVVDTYSNGEVIDYPGVVSRLAKQKVYAVHTIT